MKLLIAGNLANHGYFLAKLLRNHGLSVDLLTRKNPIQSEDPKHFDSEMKDYPDWIRFWDGRKFTWKYEVIRIMREYDIIHASTELPIFSLLSGKPYVAFSTGSDVLELAHENTIKGLLLRTAYHRAKVFIYSGPYMYRSVKKLEIQNALFIPILWDYTKFHPDKKMTKSDTKFTIFHPTNHIWSVKKNDIFLRAFVKLAKEKSNIHLILINRGSDFHRSVEILDNPHAKDKFTIINETLPQNELPKFYNQSDVVVDQFGLESTGLIGQEAMACEKPLIQYVDKPLYEKFYSEAPPILSASTEKEIYDILLNLINDKELCKKIGKQSREWLLKYHDNDTIIKKYIYIYTAVNNKTNFQTIKDNLLSI